MVTRWIATNKKLPQVGLKVLALGINEHRKPIVIKAFFLLKHSIIKDGDLYNYNFYYYPEGWYEYSELGDYTFRVPFDILYWMPLPTIPKALKKR